MIFDWFTYKKYPLFWKNYLQNFKGKQPKSIENTRFVVIDTETTGLKITTDKMLSIGAIGITNTTINVADSIEIYLIQEEYTTETVEIHGILKSGNIKKVTEQEAIETFTNFIKNAVLIGHHIAFDVEMINTALKRMQLPKLKNKQIDTGILYKKLEGKKEQHYALDYLCNEFKIPKHDRHTASGDAFITALLFLKILSKLKKQRNVHYSDLFRTTAKKGLL